MKKRNVYWVSIFFTLMLSFSLLAQDAPVKESLADMIEEAARKTGLSFNVVPDYMTESSVNINMIEGVSVCTPSAKNNVIALQRAFLESAYLRQTISIYGAYTKTRGGELKYLSGDSPGFRELVGDCKYLYVSVW